MLQPMLANPEWFAVCQIPGFDVGMELTDG